MSLLILTCFSPDKKQSRHVIQCFTQCLATFHTNRDFAKTIIFGRKPPTCIAKLLPFLTTAILHNNFISTNISLFYITNYINRANKAVQAEARDIEFKGL